jgi:hypothetical protein
VPVGVKVVEDENVKTSASPSKEAIEGGDYVVDTSFLTRVVNVQRDLHAESWS